MKIASAQHLGMMKIHALKHYQEHRFARDYNDLLGLIRTGKTELTRNDLKDICIKYASVELSDKITSEIDLSVL